MEPGIQIFHRISTNKSYSDWEKAWNNGYIGELHLNYTRSPGSWEHRPLSYAIEKENFAVFRFLLEKGADPHFIYGGECLLSRLITKSGVHEEIKLSLVRELVLTYKVQLNHQNIRSGETPLYEAVCFKYVTIIAFLIEQGARWDLHCKLLQFFSETEHQELPVFVRLVAPFEGIPNFFEKCMLLAPKLPIIRYEAKFKYWSGRVKEAETRAKHVEKLNLILVGKFISTRSWLRHIGLDILKYQLMPFLSYN